MTRENFTLNALKDIKRACGPYAHWEADADNPETNKLWVVFSHVNIPEGKFAQKNAFASVPGHKLFLNCEGNAWYTKGIADFSKSLSSTINKIKKATAEFDVSYIGHSMGAYLSLVMGHLNPQSHFISTSPELFLGLPHSRSRNNGITGTGRFRSIEDLKPNSANPQNGVTFFGVYDPIDCYFLASDLSENIGTTYEVPYHHGVTEFFSSQNIYLDILQSQDSGNEYWANLKNRHFVYYKGYHGSKDQYLHFYQTFVAFLNNTDDDTKRALVSVHNSWMNPGWQELRSKIWNQLGETHKSFEAAELAYSYDPNIMEFIDTYGTACIRYKEASRLNDAIGMMTTKQRNHVIGKRLIETAHKEFGKSFHQVLGKKVEGSANPFWQLNGPQSQPTSRQAITAADLHKLNMSKDYDKVLSLTSPSSNSGNQLDHDLAPGRAMALVCSGNKSAGIRLVRSLILAGANGPYFFRTVIGCARRTRNVSLVRQYLQMDIPEKNRREFCRFLAPCLDFITSPQLVARVLAELAQYGKEDLSVTLTETSKRINSKTMDRSIAQNLCYLLVADDLTQANREIVAAFVAKHDTQILSDIWAGTNLNSEG